MTIYFGSDHAGFAMKEKILAYVRDDLHYDVEDCGAYTYDTEDDYPQFIAAAARMVSEDPDDSKAIIFGGSGQGEAMVANKFPHVRAALYYGASQQSQTDAQGKELDMVTSTRIHNDANVLSLGARFMSLEEAKSVVSLWLSTPFSNEDRHMRRIAMIEHF